MDAELTRRRRSGRRGLTLIEVVVSAAIVSLLVLAIAGATVPVSRANSEVSIALDMDRVAANVLEQLRREVRLSGRDSTDNHKFGETTLADSTGTAGLKDGGNSIIFQKREKPDAQTNPWSTSIVYRRVGDSPSTFSGVPGTIARYRIEREQNSLTTVIAKDVSEFTLTYPSQGNSIIVSLTLTRPNPNWGNTGTPPDAIQKTYVDRIQLMNNPE